MTAVVRKINVLGNGTKTALTVLASAALVVGCAALVVLLTNVHSRSPATTALVANQPSASQIASSAPAVPVAAPSAAPTPVSVAPLTYTVKPGDSLTSIAAWFHLQGYGALYDENKDVIGTDPGLIHPGQIITISSQGITIG